MATNQSLQLNEHDTHQLLLQRRTRQLNKIYLLAFLAFLVPPRELFVRARMDNSSPLLGHCLCLWPATGVGSLKPLCLSSRADERVKSQNR
jgi:hypothetical protein